jgi:ribosomal silencing factor RsfS
VVDAVREAGFPSPRIEGEENGEWIIVDCGAAVAHIMQPAIRQYYHLEEILGRQADPHAPGRGPSRRCRKCGPRPRSS